MGERIISAASLLPIGMEELLQHCRAEGAADPAMVETAAHAAVEWAEQKTQRSLVQQTRELSLVDLSGAILLAASPVIQVLSIKYLDADGVVQTCAPSVYQLTSDGKRSTIVLAHGQAWPAVRGDVDCVTIRYLAGFTTPVSINTTSDVISLPGGRTVADGALLRFCRQDKVAGVLPTGLAEGLDVYAINSAGATFQVALTEGGAAIDLTGTPAGITLLGEVPASVRSWIKLAVGTMYENRETEIIGTIASTLKFADRLLDRASVPRL